MKESGTAFWGKTNWRRRWFRLVQRKGTSILQYFRLELATCTRELANSRRSLNENSFTARSAFLAENCGLGAVQLNFI